MHRKPRIMRPLQVAPYVGRKKTKFFQQEDMARYNALKAHIKQRGMTQKMVAAMMRVPASRVSWWFGGNRPKDHEAAALAVLLDMEVETLLECIDRARPYHRTV